ncbi:MAG: hypothetical protein R3294_00035 [Arenibacter troitsensis]|nr:hypothetical protein [Arenibacter troitsensis]
MRSQTTTILSGRWPGGLEQGFYGREVEDAKARPGNPCSCPRPPRGLLPEMECSGNVPRWCGRTP